MRSTIAKRISADEEVWKERQGESSTDE